MIKEIKDSLAFLFSKHKLKKYLNASNIDAIIDATKQFTGHGFYDRIAMSQKRTEIKNLANEVKAINPKVIVEIGTRKGGTLFVWCRYTNAENIISIDLPGGIHGGGYPYEKQKFYKYFLSDQPNRKIHLLQCDSHNAETLTKVKSLIGENLIDFLFIDGDHTYQGVQEDFKLYSPLVRKGGLIAFHDIVPNTTNHEDSATIEVPRFWADIKEHFDSREFIESSTQQNMGIGLVYWK